MSETTEQHEFEPDWCLAPEGLLREWIADNIPGLHLSTFALTCAGTGDQDKALARIQEVLDRKPLGPWHASLLARGTGIRAPFWLEYERIYRAGLAAGLADVTDPRKGSPS